MAGQQSNKHQRHQPLVVIVKILGGHQRDKQATKCAAYRHAKIKLCEPASVRWPATVQLAVAQHAHHKQQGIVRPPHIIDTVVPFKTQPARNVTHARSDQQQHQGKRAKQAGAVPTRVVEGENEGDQVQTKR